MLVASLVFVGLILGVLMYALAANPKVQELGRIMYAGSIFALMYTLAGKLIHFL